MLKSELNNEYLTWMCQLVSSENLPKVSSYQKLLSFLHNTPFSYILELDGNRFEDGVNLRYRFGYEQKHCQALIANFIDDKDCSVLEMMIALSIRCEEHIMDNPDIGNRTSEWFWEMIKNLKLENMTNNMFDESKVFDIINKLLTRNYMQDGCGGLFRVNSCKYDFRNIEIWYQMCWYLDENYAN